MVQLNSVTETCGWNRLFRLYINRDLNTVQYIISIWHPWLWYFGRRGFGVWCEANLRFVGSAMLTGGVVDERQRHQPVLARHCCAGCYERHRRVRKASRDAGGLGIADRLRGLFGRVSTGIWPAKLQGLEDVLWKIGRDAIELGWRSVGRFCQSMFMALTGAVTITRRGLGISVRHCYSVVGFWSICTRYSRF